MVTKYITILISLLTISLQMFAKEYSLDLRDVEYPKIKKDFKMGNPGPKGKKIEVNSLYMTFNGEPVLPVMGEFHYCRYNHRYWKDNLLKMKASGINIVSTYVLWIYHEEIEGRMEWTGNNNLREFIELCDEVGLLVHLRIGPYCNAEARNGGLPDWLIDKEYIKKRYNDPLYLSYVKHWYSEIAKQVDGLLYKEGGPVMAVQLENEYVTAGQVVPHLMKLKQMAIEVGFDLPLYTMTHWMSSDYPKKEIIPYAGYYIETPWTAGTNELPVSNFQFFSYNRLSDNIGTDIIKLDGNVKSLNSDELESPYFTCEVGLGTPVFYHRRPIVPKKMAGANINLRLGCGVNLMGYYMYSGGSNQVGKLTTLQSSTSRISYDYQAPLKEFGTLGIVMNEAKKYNYFMNDFGSELATMVAYLPKSNDDTENLQWAVRANEDNGYLFCSNYLYKKRRRRYNNVKFRINLKDEILNIPRKPVDIIDGAYFMWPFNMNMGNVLMKYSTTQPITKIFNGDDKLWVFFQDDMIPAEYFFEKRNIKNVKVTNGTVCNELEGFFIHDLKPGTDCIIEIHQNNGKIIKILTLPEKLSDKIWRVKDRNKEYIALTDDGIIVDNSKLVLFSDNCEQEVLLYPEFENIDVYEKNGIFSVLKNKQRKKNYKVDVVEYKPMEESLWISPKDDNIKIIEKCIDVRSLSKVKEACLRCATSCPIDVYVNNVKIDLRKNDSYYSVNLDSLIINDWNTIRFVSKEKKFQIIGEVEVFTENGSRYCWNTDQTWEAVGKIKKPVVVLDGQRGRRKQTFSWQKSDRLVYYKINIPDEIFLGDEEVRLVISFKGERAEAFIGDNFIHDYLYDGTDWVIGINRFEEQLKGNSLLVRVKAFNTANPDIYFEKYVDKFKLDEAIIKKVEIKPEYRFKIEL